MVEPVHLVSDLGIGVQSEGVGRVGGRQQTDVLQTSGNAARLLDVGQLVALVEFESWRQEPVAEPQLRERHQQPLVEIVRHSTAVLSLPDHVTHRRPRYSCNQFTSPFTHLIFLHIYSILENIHWRYFGCIHLLFK